MLQSLGHDLRYALRTLALNPGFACVSVLALALGIGANTAVFTVVNSVLLQPLRFQKARQLIVVRERDLEAGFPEFSLSPGNYADYRDQNHSFSGFAAWNGNGMNFVGRGEPERLTCFKVTTNFSTVMHAQPIIGRSFTKQEGELGSERVVILSHGFWQRRFGGRREVLSDKMNLDGKIYQVVGVMPRGFEFPATGDLWAPLAMKQAEWQQRGAHYLNGIGRLREGATLASAQSDLNGIAARLQKEFPESNHGWDTTLIGLQESVVGDVRPAMLTLLAAVGFVLLIACVNLANLLLSRAAARRREIGIRSALGAGRGRLMQQLLTESIVLAGIGAALGLALAWAGTRLLVTVDPDILPRAPEIALDAEALAFTAAIAVLTGILFGLAPALQMGRAAVSSALRDGGRGNSSGFKRNSLRSVLVTAEVALALVLLSGAGLLIRSFYRLQSVNPGFDAQNVLTFRIDLPDTRYPKDAEQAAFYARAIERIRALPGVSQAGAASIFPLAGNDYILTFTRVGKPPKSPGVGDNAMIYAVTPGYFDTLKIPLKAGRYFTDADSGNRPHVAIISETMAHQYYPNENPLGQRLTLGSSRAKPAEIVGIVGDVRDMALNATGRAAIYEAENQLTFNSMVFGVRTGGNPESLISGVRAAIRELDRELPLDAVGTVESLVETSISQQRFATLLMAVFAALALVLAMVGIYGVLSYSVTQATQEIGIRVALGAQRKDVLRLVLNYGGVLIGAGIAVGIGGALAASRVLESQLYEVHATDPATYGAVALALVGTGLLACVIPALRAVRVDPLVALREQ